MAELARLVDLHYLYFTRPDPDTLLDLDAELEREISSGLAVLGYEPEAGFADAFAPLGRNRELRGAGRSREGRSARARAPAPAGAGSARRVTYSVVAVDDDTGAYGVAVASKALCVGAHVPWGNAEVGAVRPRRGTTSATARRGSRCSSRATPPPTSCTR